MIPTALLLVASSACAAEPVPGLTVPDGFTVTQFAGPELANDVYTLHIDAAGRVVVAGRGYVRQLLDADADGIAERAVDLIPPPDDGPMGLLWEGETLFVTHAGGVNRYRGVRGDGPTTAKPDRVIRLKTGGEHDAHAVRRGPDGRLWVLCGNMAGVTEKTITAADSPVRRPVAGCLLRMTDDGGEVAVVADGFRNPYDFDFDPRGVPFTYDSDNERCVGLPWYEPTRFYRVPAGGNHGWLSPQHAQTWRQPPYFPDTVAPVVTAGRGSPTGVACYRHTRFPAEYRGGFFYADWTFGTVWFTRPSDDKPKATAFLETVGTNGFAPTGLAVHPKTGDLYVSVGGRGTRGAVYRITWTRSERGEPIPIVPAELPQVERRPIDLNPADFTAARTPAERLRVVCGWWPTLGGLVSPEAVGTVWEGYTLRKAVGEKDREAVLAAIRPAFPSGHADLDRELSRMMAVLADAHPDSVDRVTKHLDEQTEPVARVHDLIVLGRLTAPRTDRQREQIANALVSLDPEYERLGLARDRHWPTRLSETVVVLTKHDPGLLRAVLGHPRFGHAEHLWLARLPGVDRTAAARAFVSKAAADRSYPWAAGHVSFLAALPEADRRPLLLKLSDRGLADAVLPVLARKPIPEDRERFVRGLSSASAAVVTACCKSVGKLRTDGPAPLVPLIRALRRFPDPKADRDVRKAVTDELRTRTGESFGEVLEWEQWLGRTHPELAKQLASAGYDVVAWRKKLATVDWAGGDAGRGKAVYARAQCAACHNGGSAVGPSLVGVTKRFNRDDLLTTILEPSRDIPARYRTVKFATTDDRVFEGVVIYEAHDGVILQTGADSTVRIAGNLIDAKTPGTRSLMPAGLLDPLSADEIAHLFAYLQSLDSPNRSGR